MNKSIQVLTRETNSMSRWINLYNHSRERLILCIDLYKSSREWIDLCINE